GARGIHLVGAVAERGLHGGDVMSDPAEQLLGRLHDDAVLAREIARAEHLQRVIGERRRHVRTVRSAARARNRPRGALAVLVIAILVVLWALAARADAGPADETHEVRARTARIAGT